MICYTKALNSVKIILSNYTSVIYIIVAAVDQCLFIPVAALVS